MPKTKPKSKAQPNDGIRKVAIVGYAPTCQKTPFERDDMHFWGMNDIWTVLPHGRWNAWFDLHHEHVMKANPRSGEKHWHWMRGIEQFPIYTLEAVEEIPQSVAFPLDDCAALSPRGKRLLQESSEEELRKKEQLGRRYFTSTPAYMVALAVLQGYEEIHVYGINLMGEEEYAFQKPCFEYWCGMAEGRGIEVVEAEGCTVLGAAGLYGYDTHGAELSPLHKHIKAKLIEHESKRRTAELQKAALDGACEALRYMDTMTAQAASGGLMPEHNKPLPVLNKATAELVQGWHERKPEAKPANGQDPKTPAPLTPEQVAVVRQQIEAAQAAQTKE